MKYVIVLFLLLAAAPARSQEWVINLNLGLRKTFETGKKSTLDLRQQLQLTPEIASADNPYGDFFNEDGFWPVPDRDDDDDDNDDDNGDDDDDAPANPGNGNTNPVNELNDTPKELNLDWRSISAIQYNYQFVRWMRANAGYGLTYVGEEFRHTFRAELDYRPLRHWKGKRKLDLAARTLFQYVGNPDDGRVEWEALLTPRLDAVWALGKSHSFTLSNALNGAWDDGVLEFDRWRVTANLGYTYHKKHRFSLSYQYQKRLRKARWSQGFSLGYEVRF